MCLHLRYYEPGIAELDAYLDEHWSHISRAGKRNKDLELLLEWAQMPLDHQVGIMIFVLGMMLGDEGKGKIVSWLIEIMRVAIGFRFQGGCNAGHVVIRNGQRLSFHLIPESLAFGGIGMIGAGCVLHPSRFIEEVSKLQEKGVEIRPGLLFIDRDTTVTTGWHLMEEALVQKGDNGTKTTGRAIGPTAKSVPARARVTVFALIDSHDDYANLRNQLTRIRCEYAARSEKEYRELEDNFEQELEKLKELGRFIAKVAMVCRTDRLVAHAQDRGVDIAFIGGQGAHLDPLRSSPTSTATSIFPPQGVNMRNVFKIGVAKQRPTCSGDHPLPTMILDEREAGRIRVRGKEVGKSTGRDYHIYELWIEELVESQVRMGVDVVIFNKVDLDREPTPVNWGMHWDGRPVSWWPCNWAAWDKSQPNQCSVRVSITDHEMLPRVRGRVAGIRQWEMLPESLRTRMDKVQELLDLVSAQWSSPRLRIGGIGNGEHSRNVVIKPPPEKMVA